MILKLQGAALIGGLYLKEGGTYFKVKEIVHMKLQNLEISSIQVAINIYHYGFRSSQSTADLLTVVSDRIARAFNRSGTTRTVALDISKAFDWVWSAGLLHKLKYYGILGFEWFWMGILHKNIQLTLEFLKDPFCWS